VLWFPNGIDLEQLPERGRARLHRLRRFALPQRESVLRVCSDARTFARSTRGSGGAQAGCCRLR
jgi:hypothetical protein